MVMATTDWSQEMTEAWKATRGLIVHTLAGGGCVQDVDDVLQKTWIAANASLGSFDPEKGAFAHWIKGVARKQALRHMSGEAYRSKAVGAAEAAAASDAVTPYDVTGTDPGLLVMEQLDAIRRVSQVMVVLRQVVGEVPVLLERSMHLVLDYDGDVPAAARGLEVRQEALRDSHRNILDLAQVIDKALSEHWARANEGRAQAPVTTRDLLGCLPAADAEHRQWITAMVKAVMACGGFECVTATALAEATGWSVTYCRHGLARTQRLLSVALSVIRTGTVAAD